MNYKAQILKKRADEARLLYKRNLITRSEAYKDIAPYIRFFNEKSKEIAKKYNQHPKFLNFSSYLR